jgi:osmotically-inducible protein OsmY
MSMTRQTLGYLMLTALVVAAPACGRSDTSGVNRRDMPATDRASQVTNDADHAQSSQSSAPGRDRNTTGTTGSVAQSAGETEGAGPDATITMKIQAKYAGDDVVKGRNIDVDTEEGVVTLKGSVDSLRERDAAEQLARETAGVKRVINDLKVAR